MRHCRHPLPGVFRPGGRGGAPGKPQAYSRVKKRGGAHKAPPFAAAGKKISPPPVGPTGRGQAAGARKIGVPRKPLGAPVLLDDPSFAGTQTLPAACYYPARGARDYTRPKKFSKKTACRLANPQGLWYDNLCYFVTTTRPPAKRGHILWGPGHNTDRGRTK